MLRINRKGRKGVPKGHGHSSLHFVRVEDLLRANIERLTTARA